MGANKTFVPPDNDQRQIILHELDTTILVEAAAGTGKTTCMVGRMVNLLAAGLCSIDTMAAVTFTRKAAAELRSRFQVALEHAYRNADRRSRPALEAALSGVDRCLIGTIHSFCARMLRERPVEAGVDMDFQETDEDEDHSLRTQAWNQYVSELYSTRAPILQELEDLGVEISQLAPTFMRLADYPDVEEWPSPEVRAPDPEPAWQALAELVRHMERLWPTLPENPGNDQLIPRYRHIPLMFRQAARGGGLVEIMELLSEFKTVKTVQKIWPGGKDQAKEELERWETFRTTIADPLVTQWREHRYAPLLRAVRPAMEVYERLKASAGKLSYQDLLMKAAALLRDGSTAGIRKYFRKRFSHVLVDEFQDTDPVQAEVIMLLAAENAEETDWRKCRPVPGSLFVVGDPKQSIYRFRRADIVTYNQVKRIIEQHGGKVVNLTANFRATRALVDWVNETFADEFGKFPVECSPEYVALNAVHDDREKLAFSPVRCLPVPKDCTTNAQIGNYEADLIGVAIRHAIDSQLQLPRKPANSAPDSSLGAEPGDFLIITRNKENLSTYSRKLQEMRIPHQVTGGKALNQVEELRLLHRCLVALTQPNNPVALVAVLRGELFGISDPELFAFKRAGGRFSLNAAVPCELDQTVAELFDEAFSRLRQYSMWLSTLPPVAAIERIGADLGLVMRAAARPGGDVQAGSLLKALELLRSSQADLWSSAELVDYFDRLVSQDEAHDAISARADRRSAVRVMNLHKVKGLEAPVVFLADPTGSSEHAPLARIDRSGDTVRGYLAVTGTERGSPRTVLLAQPQYWEAHAAAERQFQHAEELRLLYVAATRAGCGLTVSMRQFQPSRNPWNFFDTALKHKPELTESGGSPPLTIEKGSVTEQERRDVLEQIRTRWMEASQRTYDVRAVKATVVQHGRFIVSHGEYGTEWGSAIHLLLQAAMLDPNADIRALAEAALTDMDLSLILTEAAVETVQSVIRSDVWKRARAAQKRLVEVPFQRLVCGEGQDTALSTIIRGVIDLAFKEPDGWVIVDYKSDRVSDARIGELVELYSPQVMSYAQAWPEIIGEPVCEAGLYFTHVNRYIPVQSDCKKK